MGMLEYVIQEVKWCAIARDVHRKIKSAPQRSHACLDYSLILHDAVVVALPQVRAVAVKLRVQLPEVGEAGSGLRCDSLAVVVVDNGVPSLA